jgi:hypothetical protein
MAKLLNGNLIEIQDHVGHADPLSTMRYLRATQRESRAEWLAGLGEALRSGVRIRLTVWEMNSKSGAYVFPRRSPG